MRHKIIERLKKHGLFKTLLELEGNPRACVYTEPLWGIPYNLYMPFATLFMYELGVNDQQIGFLLTIGMLFEVVASLFGGIMTDKIGRRKTTLIFDVLSWSIPPLIWMVAQNFWYFLVAIILNSVWEITNNSWNCLLVEDCEPDKLVNVYTWVNISGLLAIFFSPIASFFVGKYTVLPTLRVLYFITFVMMTTKFIILYFWSTETEVGKRRIEETKNESVLSMLKGYKGLLISVFKSSSTMFALVLKVIIGITSMATSSFFALYITQDLGLGEEFAGYFPIVRAIVMLIFIFWVLPRVNELKFKPVMLTGIGLYLIANILLVFTTKVGVVLLIPYVLSDAFACALLAPRSDSIYALFVDKEERARIMGLLFVITIACTAPFGVILGWLSSINRILPFVMNCVLYILCGATIFFSKPLDEHDSNKA